MNPVLWIVFYLTVWATLAVWTVLRSRGNGRPFESVQPATVPVRVAAARNAESSRRTTLHA